jgi:hypothetical protein
MKKSLLFICIIPGLFTISCNDPDKVSLNHDEFLKCWTYSYEESAGGDDLLFRPCDFKEFPASRYRDRFTLYETTEATYLQLGLADGHYTVPGTWNYNDEAKLLTILNTSGDTVYHYHVHKIETDKLILKED